MFRTFKQKSGESRGQCVSGIQNNIIYVSHIGHASAIWLIIYKLFNIEPHYYEDTSNKFVEEQISYIKDFNIHSSDLELYKKTSEIDTKLSEIKAPLGNNKYFFKYE